MKTLYIIRHAKSSWENPDRSDFDRGLNDRGKRDAPRMGKRLKEKEIYPDLILSSPAKRALSTAKRIAKVLGYPESKIKTDRDLYHAAEETMLSIIQNLKDKNNIVFVFGHNPGLTDFVNTLMDQEGNIDNVPTCGIVAFKLHVDSWNDVRWGSGKMIFFDYPKSV
jgi:phosphohistidine phosphatase